MCGGIKKGLPPIEQHPSQMRRAGIDVNTDWQEGERILSGEKNIITHFSDSKEEFDIIRNLAIQEKGIVIPHLETKVVNITSVPKHDFTGSGKEAIKKARLWAKDNIFGEYQGFDSRGNSFIYKIDNKAVGKLLSQSSTSNSDNLGVHLAVLKKLVTVIENSIEVEIHADYIKNERVGRSLNSQIGYDTLVHRFYGAITIEDVLFRVKSTILETRGQSKTEPHDYKVAKVDVILNGGSPTSNAPRTSTIAVAKLLNNSETTKDLAKKELPPVLPLRTNRGGISKAVG